MPIHSPNQDVILDEFKDIVEKTSGDTEGRATQTESKVDALTTSQAHIDKTRVFVARAVVFTYVLATFILVIFLIYKSLITPLRSSLEAPIDAYATAAIDLLKVIIFPVMTFTLGYYFKQSRND